MCVYTMPCSRRCGEWVLFGLASHLGVLADILCVGVAKKLCHIDGIRKGPEHKEKVLTSALSFSLSQFTTSLSALSCRVFIENVIACHCLAIYQNIISTVMKSVH